VVRPSFLEYPHHRSNCSIPPASLLSPRRSNENIVLSAIRFEVIHEPFIRGFELEQSSDLGVSFTIYYMVFSGLLFDGCDEFDFVQTIFVSQG